MADRVLCWAIAFSIAWPWLSMSARAAGISSSPSLLGPSEVNTCDISEFRCPSKDGQGTLCLPMDRWCNGKDDCDNRVDEPRSCSSKQTSFLHYHLRRSQTISVILNSIQIGYNRNLKSIITLNLSNAVGYIGYQQYAILYQCGLRLWPCIALYYDSITVSAHSFNTAYICRACYSLSCLSCIQCGNVYPIYKYILYTACCIVS